jgi:hypothetical protein
MVRDSAQHIDVHSQTFGLRRFDDAACICVHIRPVDAPANPDLLAGFDPRVQNVDVGSGGQKLPGLKGLEQAATKPTTISSLFPSPATRH